MYVCMYVCNYVSMYACMYICIYEKMFASMQQRIKRKQECIFRNFQVIIINGIMEIIQKIIHESFCIYED